MPSENPLFGQNLKKHRKERGITQQQLADKMGVTKGCISNWERGFRDAGSTEIYRVAEALGIDPKRLIERRNGERNGDS